MGLKVDLDEISGKGKSMFMITATGTAVVIENINKTQNKVNIKEKLEVISFEKMIELRKRKNIIQLAIDKKLELDDSIWEFISENSIYEISNEILEKVSKAYETPENKNKLYNQLLTYISSLSEEHRTTLLYDFLMNSSSSSNISLAYKLIYGLMVFDSDKLQQYLSDNNEDVKSKALQIVVCDKPFYTIDDIAIFKNLIHIIETKHNKIGEISTQKKLLSSKEKDIWICKCANKNDISTPYCSKCNKDIYGYFPNQINPEMAIDKLKINIELINDNVV